MPEGISGQAGQDGNVTQSPAATQTSVSAPEGFVEKKRLDGALQKVEELVLANKALTERLNALTGEKATLMADYGQKEAAWATQQNEFTTKLESANSEKTQLQSELAKSKALELKLKLIAEAKAPQLYSIIGAIADTTDEAAMRTQIQALAGFANQISQNREKELLAGVTTIEQQQTQPNLPSNDKGWQEYIGKLNFGTPEYQKAMEQWHSWLFKQS